MRRQRVKVAVVGEQAVALGDADCADNQVRRLYIRDPSVS
jgi:hypothetical protein